MPFHIMHFIGISSDCPFKVYLTTNIFKSGALEGFEEKAREQYLVYIASSCRNEIMLLWMRNDLCLQRKACCFIAFFRTEIVDSFHSQNGVLSMKSFHCPNDIFS